MRLLILTILFISGIDSTHTNDPQEGYAIIRNDTIYGSININFEAGSIIVKQDSINRMFTNDIHQVTLLLDEVETYIPIQTGNRTTFHKVLVNGKSPLLLSENQYFIQMNGKLMSIIDEKSLYEIFDKRDVKDYLFLRNIDIDTEEGMIDVFRYFNTHESF